MTLKYSKNLVFGIHSFILALFVGGALSFFAPTVSAAKENGSSTIANDARLGGVNARTRFVADLSKPTDYRIFTLADHIGLLLISQMCALNCHKDLAAQARDW